METNEDPRVWLNKEPVSHMDPKWAKKKDPILQHKMDTQGMSGPTDPSVKITGKQEYKPAIKQPRRLFTHEYAKEMKILINEVLDEREGKFTYTSYFDTRKFVHPVTEEEPEYKPRYKPAYYQ